MNQSLRVIFSITIIGFVFYGIILKVFSIPITHDEAWTVLRYTPLSPWDIMMYSDSWPNNHILNTLLAKFSIGVFGMYDWSTRIPNLISFVLYAFSAAYISFLIFKRDVILYFMALLLLLGNPFANDFFSLCRGYGLSLSFVLSSALFLLLAFDKKKDLYAFIALLFSTLAAYSNFTCLVFWLASLLLLAFYFMVFSKHTKRALLKLLFVLISFGALIITPLIKMNKDNQFKYWSSEGFFVDTILSSTEAWRYGAKLIWEFDYDVLGFVIVIIYMLMGLYFIVHFMAQEDKTTFMQKPFAVLFLLLSLSSTINFLQCLILGTPYLSGRTALLYFPLFISCFVAFIGLVSHNRLVGVQYLRVLAVFLIIFSSVHLVDRFDKRFVRAWWYDANTLEVIDYLSNVENQTIQLATNWIFHPSFSFYCESGFADHIRLNAYSKTIEEYSNADYYYVELKDVKALEKTFSIEKQFAYDRFLLKRIK